MKHFYRTVLVAILGVGLISCGSYHKKGTKRDLAGTEIASKRGAEHFLDIHRVALPDELPGKI